MKRILSVVAILAVAIALVPMKGYAGLRGSFEPITTSADNLVKGHFDPVPRPGLNSAIAGNANALSNRWITYVTTSSVVGSESVGEIWLQRNVQQFVANTLAVNTPANGAILVAAGLQPILRDATGGISYVDPAWSYDGKWLAYVKTDNFVTSSSIYVQQFGLNTAALTGTPPTSITPLSSPVLVADGTGGIHHRHSAWKHNNTQIAYDSDAFGPSIDLWTVNIALDATAHTATVDESSRTRHMLGFEGTPTILNSKAEFKPSYSPDGTKIAYVTNQFGPFVINLLTPTADGLHETVTGAETSPATVTHDNPDWSTDGASLYYDAPASEDPANPQDIWKLDLATGAKCPIHIDLAGDVNASVEQIVNHSTDGIPYNYIYFTSQAAGFGVQIWRGNYVQDCVAPLPIGVQLSPNSINLDQTTGGQSDSCGTGGNGGSDPNGGCNGGSGGSKDIVASITMPPEVQALGYIALGDNIIPEGIKMRTSILPSPTMNALKAITDPQTGIATYTNHPASGQQGAHVDVHFAYRATVNQLVALGLVNENVPMRVEGFGAAKGRAFLGFGILNLSSSHLSGSVVSLKQNYPNPFNPKTNVTFANSKAGNVDVRVFSVRGELVRTIANSWYPMGEHTVSWDGSTERGGHAPSGIYYIRAHSGASNDVIKAVIAK